MKIAVIDFETTGIDPQTDEVLQVSIIDENYNTILNTYCRPTGRREWREAERINKISPLMVENKMPFESYKEKVQRILDNAECIIAYNVWFESNFLKKYEIKVDESKWVDPMIVFAEIYGELKEHYSPEKHYKWQKLEVCAGYYGYKFKAHDALEDVKATLFSHYCITKTPDFTVGSCVCDYAVCENGVLIPQLIFGSRKRAEQIAYILNLETWEVLAKRLVE